jgi:hypothetical protein
MGFCLLQVLTALLALFRGANLLKPHNWYDLLALLLVTIAYGLYRRWRWAWQAWIVIECLILLQVAVFGTLIIAILGLRALDNVILRLVLPACCLYLALQPEVRRYFSRSNDEIEAWLNLLRIRISHSVHGDLSLSREDLPGLSTCVALDLGQMIRFVKAEEVAEIGVPEEIAFDAALFRVRHSPMTRQVEDQGSFKVVTYRDDDDLAHARVLLMEEDADCLGPYGALVILPVRNFSACVPITGSGVTDAMTHLARRAKQLAEPDNHRIATNIYWYHIGLFTDLPYTWNADQQPEFMLLDEFQRLLREMNGR